MSWWVYLQDDNGHPVAVAPHQEGGTYVLGGLSEAELNVTYNYGQHFSDAGVELHYKGGNLHGKKAKEVVDLLQQAVNKLGTKTSKDYWAPTPGNAGHALSILLSWARQHPEATFEVH